MKIADGAAYAARLTSSLLVARLVAILLPDCVIDSRDVRGGIVVLEQLHQVVKNRKNISDQSE